MSIKKNLKLKRISSSIKSSFDRFKKKRESFAPLLEGSKLPLSIKQKKSPFLSAIDVVAIGSELNDFRRFKNLKYFVEKKNFSEAKREYNSLFDHFKNKARHYKQLLELLFVNSSPESLSYKESLLELKIFFTMFKENPGNYELLGRLKNACDIRSVLSNPHFDGKISLLMKKLFLSAKKIINNNYIKDSLQEDDVNFNKFVLEH